MGSAGSEDGHAGLDGTRLEEIVAKMRGGTTRVVQERCGVQSLLVASGCKTLAAAKKGVRPTWSLNIARLRGAESSLLLLSLNSQQRAIAAAW